MGFELVFRSCRTLIGCWVVWKKAHCLPGAVREQYAFFRTGKFGREISEVI